MEDWDRELWEQAEAEGAVGRIYRDDETGEIVSEIGEVGAVYVRPPVSRPPRRSPVAPLAMRRPARTARPRERRALRTRRATRAGPGGDDPPSDPEPSRRGLLRLAACWLVCAGLIDVAFAAWWWSR